MAEDYERWRPATTCVTTPGAGTVALRDYVIQRFGGEDLGILRGCAGGPSSLHHEGRAWDWGTVREPADVDGMIAWLMAPGPDGPHHWLRRLGIVSIIWERRIWSTTRQFWRPYRGADPHTTHVHIGLSHRGGRGETSGYELDNVGELRVAMGEVPSSRPPPLSCPPSSS